MKRAKPVLALVAAMLAAQPHATTINVPEIPESPHPDTEHSLDIPLRTENKLLKKFRLDLSILNTPDNCLQAAFGRDENGNGALDFEETDTVFGWRGGSYFVEDVRGWRRLELEPSGSGESRAMAVCANLGRDLAPRDCTVSCGGEPAFAELSQEVPGWLFRSGWNMMCVTRRGSSASGAHVSCEIECAHFSIILR